MAWVWSTTQVGLPPAFLGVPYEVTFATSTATAASAFAVNTGALPTGLTVVSATECRVTGTPTALGTFTFTLTCAAVVSPTYTITVMGAEGDEKLTAQFHTPGAAASKRKLN